MCVLEPERYELILVPDGVAKVTIVPDSKMPNCATLTFEKEDHTLGNLLRSQLLKDERVLFAAYKIPHPLNHMFIMRVQTTEDYEPREAVTKACQAVILQLELLRQRFEQEWELKRISAEGAIY